MKALAYHGPGRHVWGEVPDVEIRDTEDAVGTVTAVGDALRTLGVGDRLLVSSSTALVPGLAARRLDTQGPGRPPLRSRRGAGGVRHAYDVFADAGSNGALKAALFRS
jgi:hypothetical protein